MGNRSSQDSDGEFHEGMLEVSDRGLGSYRLVSVRDIFYKPVLTTSESSSTTEDLAESCPCKCHGESVEQDASRNAVGNCCRCNRPKITEPADGCSCQCHTAVQEQPRKCCVCKTPVNITNVPRDNRSEEVSSEESPSASSASGWNFQTLTDWFYPNAATEESHNTTSAGIWTKEASDDTSSNSSFEDLSELEIPSI